ncbi:MAG TPA: RNA polymerase subunit sigma-70 [Chloroflexota bacterium]|nr:RNA polymerase subunit sigma-70 [Chloroflexota bacterium]
MTASPTTTASDEESQARAALKEGDAAAFSALTERYRRPLQVHCYRMLGSVEDAEDLVQETLLRAWRARATFEGRSLFKTWLYRIATNACLNTLERAPRRVLPQDIAPSAHGEAKASPTWDLDIPWLQPYPDQLLSPREGDPEAMVVERETIELAYLAALQHLPPRQRAILVLRDALGWSAKETAELLESSLASVNSALQRARETLRGRLPASRHEWTPQSQPSHDELAVLKRFMSAFERADSHALVALMREDARWAMPPAALWFDGRAAIAGLFEAFPLGWQGDLRMLASAANRQPAAAAYLRLHGESEFRLVSLNVLRVVGDAIAEVTTFGPPMVAAFRLPDTL